MLARRIARNREIAGLHYPSDSEAGKTLANESLDLLQAMMAADLDEEKKSKRFDKSKEESILQKILYAAKAEWEA